MASSIEDTRRVARKLFLSNDRVVGIGLTHVSGNELVFLLKSESPRLRERISSWARENNVGVQFQVTGEMRTLARRP